MSDKLTVKVNVSDNPWVTKYVDVLFSRDKIEVIVKELVTACSDKDYTSSWAYVGHVTQVLDKFWDSACGSIIPFYKALLLVLREFQKPNEGWHGGATAAIRCIETRLAYASPGFIEALRYNEMYGS